MRLLLVTPLYPPDIAPLAPYVKDLATRFKETCKVTILAYSHIPEKISDVDIVSIEKNQLLPIRLFCFTRALLKLSRTSDTIYVQNGPSVELPVILATLFSRGRFVLRLGDETALCHATTNSLYRLLLTYTIKRMHNVVIHRESSRYTHDLLREIPKEKIHNISRPNARPEILPFVPHPTDAFLNYESSWKKHTEELKDILTI